MDSSSQPGAGSEPPLPVRDILSSTPGGRPISDQVRASLAAVHAAREAAKLRRRRETLRARALAATALVTFVAGIFVLEHFQRQRRAAVATVGLASRGSPPMAPAGELGGSPLPATARPSAATTSVGATPAEAAVSPAGDALAACTEALAHHRLRAAASACAEAFEAQPSDAKLAMKVAQVQHARGQHQSAGDWARRAIALRTTDPDAFLIVAHAEARARRPVAADSAYRQYLAMAPRGLHASEARHALRAAKRRAQARG